MAGLEIKQKRSFHPIRWAIWLTLLGLLAASAYYGYRWFMTGELPPIPVVKATTVGLPDVEETVVTGGQVRAHTVPATHPRYISIPSIGVEQTRVFPVGVTKNNVLDTPKNIHDAAWYNKSATPGSGYGAVLIDAHNGGYTKDGIFAKLSKLVKGDEISVERGDGKVFTYIVTSNVTMGLDEVNERGMKEMMVSSDSSKEGLSLITCAGNYVPRLGQFDKRVMVRAVVK